MSYATRIHGATLVERLEGKIDFTADGCWLWTAAKDPRGYGRFGLNGKTVLAHRAVYEALIGPIPGETLDHTCVNPSCVNPDHLEPVSATVNKKRAAERRTACKRGHAWPENLRIVGSKRRCGECDRERWRA